MGDIRAISSQEPSNRVFFADAAPKTLVYAADFCRCCSSILDTCRAGVYDRGRFLVGEPIALHRSWKGRRKTTPSSGHKGVNKGVNKGVRSSRTFCLRSLGSSVISYEALHWTLVVKNRDNDKKQVAVLWQDFSLANGPSPELLTPPIQRVVSPLCMQRGSPLYQNTPSTIS